MPHTTESVRPLRRSIVVRGIVQGVGFRPFVYSLATRLGLAGFVRNQTGAVLIEIEGDGRDIERFFACLREQPPTLARIESIECHIRAPIGGVGFAIAPSEADAGIVSLPPDVATCGDCVRELFDPLDRRFRYPFINCTNCGPRLTIIEGAPYDRARTTMAAFRMCSACEREYRDPDDRRFHAQPLACAACGPRLAILGIETDDPIGDVAHALRDGKIVAVKGLGGYHLACDATSSDSVAALRARKHRDEKPFAVMVRDVAAAERICDLSGVERTLLCSHERPIVLARRATNAIANNVAPGNPLVGVMLPYTPLHHLMLREVDGIPLVMTSGNRSDEPIAFEDRDAAERLGGIADLILVHDRAIHTRCDDSIAHVVAGRPMALRRSRGYAPRAMRLPRALARPTLALGGHLKAAFALGTEDRALVGHHIGDLGDRRAYDSYVSAIEHYERVFEVRPEVVVHDLHPDYASTRYAIERGIEQVAVQHHHAHIASCLAEHGIDRPVIGVALDGSGYGTDGALWGGEILVADLRGFERVAHVRYLPLPGGERAIEEPWRMALSVLVDCERADVADRLLPGIAPHERRLVRQLIDRRIHSPMTSSMGRLFDAVAALVGVRHHASFEGQAAMELEWCAGAAAPEMRYAFEYRDGVIDARPVICGILDDLTAGIAVERIARGFHEAVIDMVVCRCDSVRQTSGLSEVALGGGVFQNTIVASGVIARLHAHQFIVHVPRELPPNDGGLALGQLAIAAAREAA